MGRVRRPDLEDDDRISRERDRKDVSERHLAPTRRQVQIAVAEGGALGRIDLRVELNTAQVVAHVEVGDERRDLADRLQEIEAKVARPEIGVPDIEADADLGMINRDNLLREPVESEPVATAGDVAPDRVDVLDRDPDTQPPGGVAEGTEGVSLGPETGRQGIVVAIHIPQHPAVVDQDFRPDRPGERDIRLRDTPLRRARDIDEVAGPRRGDPGAMEGQPRGGTVKHGPQGVEPLRLQAVTDRDEQVLRSQLGVAEPDLRHPVERVPQT